MDLKKRKKQAAPAANRIAVNMCFVFAREGQNRCLIKQIVYPAA